MLREERERHEVQESELHAQLDQHILREEEAFDRLKKLDALLAERVAKLVADQQQTRRVEEKERQRKEEEEENKERAEEEEQPAPAPSSPSPSPHIKKKHRPSSSSSEAVTDQ